MGLLLSVSSVLVLDNGMWGLPLDSWEQWGPTWRWHRWIQLLPAVPALPQQARRRPARSLHPPSRARDRRPHPPSRGRPQPPSRGRRPQPPGPAPRPGPGHLRPSAHLRPSPGPGERPQLLAVSVCIDRHMPPSAAVRWLPKGPPPPQSTRLHRLLLTYIHLAGMTS